jgi:hypothetical protein
MVMGGLTTLQAYAGDLVYFDVAPTFRDADAGLTPRIPH